MNDLPVAEQSVLPLVDIIDLKWQLAHEGIRLHVERLQHDHVYARAVLAQAAASDREALRAVARRLLAVLGDARPLG